MAGATVCLVLSIILWRANGLIRGRDAKEGEFPYVVRILVSENVIGVNETSRHLGGRRESRCTPRDGNLGDYAEYFSRKPAHDETSCRKKETVRQVDVDWEKVKIELMKEFGSNNANKIAAGTLITTSRILTTCDTVSIFSGTEKKDFPLYQVLIMAGSIHRSGLNGEFKFPNSSSRHPYCYFLLSSKTVLFNYGIYQVATPFGKESKPGTVAPAAPAYRSAKQMEQVLSLMISGYLKMKCYTFGWGNENKRFEGLVMPDNFERFTKVLQTTEMRPISDDECEQAICHHFSQCLKPLLEYGCVCAIAQNGGPCTEDWASPLVCDGVVFGLHVDPQLCRNTPFPRTFTRVDLGFEYVFDRKNQSPASIFDSHWLCAIFMNLLIFNF